MTHAVHVHPSFFVRSRPLHTVPPVGTRNERDGVDDGKKYLRFLTLGQLRVLVHARANQMTHLIGRLHLYRLLDLIACGRPCPSIPAWKRYHPLE